MCIRDRRLRAAQAAFKRTVDTIVPVAYTGLIWAAENSYGLYNPMEVYDKIGYTWDRESDEGVEIDRENFDKESRKMFYETKEFMIESGRVLRKKIQGMDDAMNKLFDEVKKIDCYLTKKITEKLSIKALGAISCWIQQVLV
eukprot:TRINITY_DN8879_c0_g1_i3.p1 TRINITY_DN8879_c0_g1~~TRINITY_DN8879_c0_g1_i3.p1  ORF type:complete len:142 (-),score=26.90 TRINITY_DN8879_c0_g1_i3:238-663(-)